MRKLVRSFLPALAASAFAASAVAQSNVVSGSAIVFSANVAHANGNVYDQVLLTGSTATLQADAAQVMRASFVDPNGDIVQVEFSGPGRVSIALDAGTYSGPAAAAKYNQPGVTYVTGLPTITVDNNTADTFLSVFSVGRVTALNASLFPTDQTYDALADVALIRLNGAAMGSVLTGNVRFNASSGMTGIYAPNTAVRNRVILNTIVASGSATPVLQFGAGSTFTQDAGSILIAGGNLGQANTAALDVSSGTGAAIVSLVTVVNVRSNGTTLPRLLISSFTSWKGGANDSLLLDGTAATLIRPATTPVQGKLLTFFAGTNPPYANGATKTFDATTATLRFDNTTLSSPATIAGLNAPMTGYRFQDVATGLTWEVYFRSGALHEINVMRGTTFAGQWQ